MLSKSTLAWLEKTHQDKQNYIKAQQQNEENAQSAAEQYSRGSNAPRHFIDSLHPQQRKDVISVADMQEKFLKSKYAENTQTPQATNAAGSFGGSAPEKNKDTDIIGDYEPLYGMTKFEYNARRGANANLPQFGSYQYFVNREKELRETLAEIEKDPDKMDRFKLELANTYNNKDSWDDIVPWKREEVLREGEALSRKFALYDKIAAEYKNIDEQIKRFERTGVHFDDAGNVDTKSGAAQAEYQGNRAKALVSAYAMPGIVELDLKYNDNAFGKDASETLQEKYGAYHTAGGEGKRADSKAGAYNYYEKNKDNMYSDNTWGRFSGNAKLGRIGIKTNDAGYVSYETNSDDIEAAQVYQLLSQRIQNRNAATFTNNTAGQAALASIAQYVPQFVDQTSNKLLGYALGSITGIPGAGNAVGSAAVANYMFRQTAGAAYLRHLQENRLSIDDAKKLAKSEALSTAAVEFGLELALSGLLQKGGNAVKKTALGESAGKLSKKVTEQLTKPLLKMGVSEKGVQTVLKSMKSAGKFALNSFGEGTEEWIQAGMQKTADRFAKEGRTASVMELFLDSFMLHKYSQEDFAQMNQDFLSALVVGFASGGAQKAGYTIINKSVGAAGDVINKAAKAVDNKKLGEKILTTDDPARYDPKKAVESIVEAGKQSSNPEVAALANEVEEQIAKGKQPTAKVGELLKEVLKSANNEKNAQTDGTSDTHTPEMQRIIEEYEAAVDPQLARYAEYAINNPQDNKTAFPLGDVSERQAADIKELTGIDTTGFGTEAKANTFRHVEHDHGKNGTTDQSMADINDVARMQYIIDNYDNMELLESTSNEFRDKNQKKAPLIRLSKRVNGTVYVVEAVPDTNKRKLEVVSTYKKAANQKLNGNPSANVQNESGVTAISTIPQTPPTVNPDTPQTPAQMVADFVQTIEGDKGRSAMAGMYRPEQSPTDYIKSMMGVYNAGRQGVPQAQVDTGVLNPQQADAAYAAGQMDAMAEQASAAKAQQVGGQRYSVKTAPEESVVDLSTDNELSRRIEGLRGSAKYKAIQEYILSELSNQPITFSDGTNVVVDKRDASHIAARSGDKKTAFISEIKKAVEKAKLYAVEENAEHNKFDSFKYYRMFVRYGEDVIPIYLNVGRAKNSGEYHLYDITQKIRETAHRLNGVERVDGDGAKDLRSGNGFSIDNRIPQDGASVNTSIFQSNQNDTSADTKIPSGSETVTGMNEQNMHDTDGKDGANKPKLLEIGDNDSPAVKTAKRVANILTERFGVEFEMYAADDGMDGHFDPDTKKIYINENAESPMLSVVAHEFLHSFKVMDTAGYNILKRITESDLNLARFNEYKKALLAAYDEKGIEYKHLDPDDLHDLVVEEAMCDLVGEMVNDPTTIEKVARHDHGLVQRIMDYLGELIDTIRAHFTEGDTEIQKLVDNYEQVKAVYQEVIGTSNARMENVGVVEGDGGAIGKRHSIPNRATKSVYDYSKSFAEQIDDYKQHKFPVRDTLIVRDTPETFRKIGLVPLPMTYTQKHLKEALINADGDHLGEALIKKLPEALENPIAIIDSSSVPGRIVSIIEIPGSKRNTIAAVEVDGMGKMHGNKIDSNHIVSVHSRNNAISKLLRDAMQAESKGQIGIYYWQKNKAVSLLRSGVQFPGGATIPNGFRHSITENGSKVNPRFKNVTKTQQFKLWFGKSKVVNKDGTPKVVYHGTSRGGFTEFDTYARLSRYGLFGNGAYFTESPTVAQQYSKKGKGESPQIYAVYLNIRNPVDMDTKANLALWNSALKKADIDADILGCETNEDVFRKVEEYIEDMGVPMYEGEEIVRTLFEDMGYDGITHMGGGRIDQNSERHRVWIAFEPTQIKSATDNIGTFDKSNPNIKFSVPRKGSRGAKAQEMLDRYEGSGKSTAALPDMGWARTYRRDAEKMNKYLANQIETAEFELEAGNKTPDQIKALEKTLENLRAKQQLNNADMEMSGKLMDAVEIGVTPRNYQLSEIIDHLKDVDTGLKIKNGNYRFNDLQRNLERVFGRHYHLIAPLVDAFDQAKGDVARNTLERLTEMHSYIEKGLGIKKGSKESKAVQWIAEGERNPNVKNADDIAALKEMGITDVRRLDPNIRVPYTRDMLYRDFDKATADKIIEAEQWFRKQYDELIDQINQTQRKIYPGRPDKQVPKRKDYMRHFREMRSGWGGLYDIVTGNASISPTLAGISEHTQPKEKWASIKQQRKGRATSEDAVGGFLDYIGQAEYAIHINPFIEHFRGLARDLAQLKEDNGDLNGFISYLNDFAADLAGKTSGWDRAILKTYGSGGRKFLRGLGWFNNRTKSNAVVGNFASMAKQPLNIPNGMAYMENPANIIGGLMDVFQGMMDKDGDIQNRYKESNFLAERFMDKAFAKFEKMSLHKIATNMLGVADEFGTRAIWNGLYREAQRMGEANPAAYADKLTRKAVGGRGIGEVPLAYKTQVGKLALPFQLEVNNTWNVWRDMLQGKTPKGKLPDEADKWLRVAIFMLVTWGMNEAMEKLLGSKGSFDPLGDIVDGIMQGKDEKEKDGTGAQLKRGALRAGQNLAGDFLGSRSFGWLAGELLDTVDDDWATRFFNDSVYASQGVNIPAVQSGFKALKKVADGDWVGAGAEVATSFLTPFGGKQLDKTVRGVADYIHGGNYQNNIYKEVSAGERGDLRYPIEQNAGNALKSFALGPSSLKSGNDHWYGKRLDEIAREDRKKKNQKKVDGFIDDYKKANPNGEVMELYNQIKRKEVFPFEAVDVVLEATEKGVKKTATLTEAQVERYQKMQNEYMLKEYDAVIGTEEWRAADADKRRALLEDARKAARADAKADMKKEVGLK